MKTKCERCDGTGYTETVSGRYACDTCCGRGYLGENEPAIKIPFGAKRVIGQSQKGDRIWNGTRWALVRKGYPFAGDSGAVIIRRCVVEQTEVMEVVQTVTKNNQTSNEICAALEMVADDVEVWD